MRRIRIRAAALLTLALATPAAAQIETDPALVAEAAEIPASAALPSIRMIGDRVYAEFPASASAPARWAFSPLAAWLAGKPAWTTALDLTPPAGEKAWQLVAVHCLGPAQARCLLQPGPGDGRTALLEYDVAANRIVPGFALPLGRRDLDWDDADHVLVAEAGKLARWARGTAFADASPLFDSGKTDALWPSRLSDTIGSLTTFVAQDAGPGRHRMWLAQGGATVPLALPETAWVSGLVQGQAVVTTADDDWAAAGVPAHSVAVVPLGELGAARPAHVRVLYTAGRGQRLASVSVARSSLFIAYDDRLRGRVLAYAWRGRKWIATPAALPANSAFRFASANDLHDYALFTEQRYGGGERRWRLMPNGRAQVVGEPAQDSGAEPRVRQFTARAGDGADLPYFVVAPAGARADAPVLVTGDGAWGNVRGPAPLGRFEQLWLRRGGVIVDALVRGGGEFGEDWHQAATGARRATSFADFRAIADDLVARGLARDGRLGLFGSDNFGLIALDAVARQPGRWRALWLSDPIADLPRAATLGVADADRAALAAEYGDPADPQVTTALAEANPLARLARDGAWPATLIQHAANDPWNRGGHTQALGAALRRAGRVARIVEVPGDFDAWQASPQRAATALAFFIAAGLDPAGRK